MKIKLNNREFDCFLGLEFLGNVIDDLDLNYKEFLDRTNRNPVKFMPLIMFHSVRYGLIENDIEIDFDKKQFLLWIQNEGGISNVEMKKFSSAFWDSINSNVPKDEEVEKEAEQESSDTKKK